jgi:hypothetical protein
MKLSTKIILLVLGIVLARGIAARIGDRPAKVQAPPGVTVTTFADLSDFELNAGIGERRPGDVLKRIPKAILGLDARKVLIQGFMMPTRLAKGQQVKEFLLASSQASCCYGKPLQLYDVVEVRMAGQPARLMMDQVITVIGNLHVKERWDGNFLGSIYQMDAETVVLAAPG